MIEICERRARDASTILLLIGPGGSGKSSLGIELAPLIMHHLVDLDQEFSRRIGDIRAFIQEEGYNQYKARNSELAIHLTANARKPTLLVTSSGFLAADNPPLVLQANQNLLKTGYSICLLPSRDLELAVSVIVGRQLTRTFARDYAREEAVIRSRYPIYARLGDLVVFSTASSGEIARAIVRHLSA